jgi:2-oxoglutarate dehydrogenase E2 component (dihydrolipoamide succinyltransferase)
MNATYNLLLPAMGEGITDATITRWLVKEGSPIELDQPLVEVATDKVDSEVPSPVKGVVEKFLFQEGQVPRVGDTIAIIRVEGMAANADLPGQSPMDNTQRPEENSKIASTTSTNQPETLVDTAKEYLYNTSPLVRRIAREEGIKPIELGTVKGTGVNGRITKEDILGYIAGRKGITSEVKPKDQKPGEDTLSTNGVAHEVIQMDRMRKLIAEHMVLSKRTSAHVTSFIEVDVSNLVAKREKEKNAFMGREGEKLTLTPFFVDAVVKTLRKHPVVNSSVEEDRIIVKKSVNIGIATALPNGNLIVPVVKNADQLNITGLAKSINDLARRARENKLKPDEIQGGTFTITNLGMFGTLAGTPIINQPQVAILAIGAIKKRPVVIESPAGDSIGIRQMAILSLSYDHRVIDGALAGSFLKTLQDIIESIKPDEEL